MRKKSFNTIYSILNTRRLIRRPLFLLSILVVLVFGTIALLATYKPSKASASWFDNAWGFRQRIPISNTSGSDQTNYQVQVSIDTASLVTAGKLQSNCADIRFTDAGGKSLPYWIEPSTCNTAATLIWVKMPLIPSTGADLYYYYGNAVAASPGNTRTSDVFIRDMSSAAASWPLQDTTSTQSYAAVTNPSLATGRNIVLNGTFDTDTIWTKGAGWDINTTTPGKAHANNSSGTLFQTLPIVQGKAYQITFTLSNFVSGGFTKPYIGGTSGTSRASNGTFTEILVAGSNTSVGMNPSTFTGDIDNIVITELNIPPSSGSPTQLLTDGDMEAAGTSAWTAVNFGQLSKVGSPHGGTQAIRVAGDGSHANPQANQTIAGIVVGQTYRIYGYARSDGTNAPSVLGLTIWTGTTSTAWQPFDLTFVATGATLVLRANTPAGGGYSDFDDVTVALDTNLRPGELTVDGGFESWTNSTTPVDWLARNAGVFTQVAGARTGGSGSNIMRVAKSGTSNPYAINIGNTLVPGKTYRVTGWVKSDGNATPRIILGGATGSSTIYTGTTSTSWTFVDANGIADSQSLILQSLTTVDTQYCDYDDFSVTEVDPLIGKPGNGVTLGSAAGGHLSTAYSFDGSNDIVNIYSSDLNSVFNPSEGTLIAWAKVSGSGVWTDGTFRTIAYLLSDANNRIFIIKHTASNSMAFQIVSGGVTKTITSAQSSTGWFQVVVTWSASANQFKAYMNGAQVGSTLTGLGTWSGNLTNSATGTNIGGANTTTGSSPWSGLINDVKLYPRALSSTEISDLYSAAADTTTYTSPTYLNNDLVRKFNTGVTVGTFATEENGASPNLHWKFDDSSAGSGQALDSSGNGNTGTLGGSTKPAWSTEEKCVDGKCLFFDGASSIVTGSRIASGVKSVSFWINPSVIGTQGIFNLDGGTHKINTNSSGAITATGFTSPTYYINGAVASTPTLTPNVWNYVTITTATAFNTTASFTVGTDGSSYLGGYLDDVRLYPYTLSPAQVQADSLQHARKIGSSAVLGIATQPLPAGLIANWGLQDSVTTQSYSAVVNPSVATGRNIVLNGTFDTDTLWTKGTGWTITGGQAVATGVVAGNTLSPNPALSLTPGKVYTVTYTVVVTSGSVVARGSQNLTTRTTSGTYSETFVATGAFSFNSITGSDFTGSIDNVSVVQVNIPPSSGNPTTLLTDGDMEAAGTGAWTVVNNATVTKQTGTPHGGTQVLRIARNGTNTPYVYQNVVTVGQPYRIYGYARSDGTAVPIVSVGTAANSFTGTTSTAWQPFDFVTVANGTNINIGSSTTSGTTYVEFDDVTVALDTKIRPGELVTNGTFDDTSGWAAASGLSISGGLANYTTGSTGSYNTLTSLVAGKTYLVTWTISNYSAGTFRVRAGTGGTSGTPRSANGTYSDAIIASGATLQVYLDPTGFTGSVDNVSVIETSPLVGKPTNGVTLGTASAGHLSTAYTFDGTNDNVNIYSSDLNSALNPGEGTVVAWAKVSGASVWTDGQTRNIVNIRADSSNVIALPVV